MARRSTTVPNSPTPHNVSEAAHRIGCSPGTLREYIRNGQIDAPRTAGGHVILFDHHLEAARKLYQDGLARRGRYGRG
jgi:excisionase family DNA binding protein